MNRQNIRNFCIIAHVDHGKSTLADRFLEITETVEQRKMKSQFLDRMDLERERGITIKLQPVKMEFEFEGEKYFLNLIDTPGHADFVYEVSRSLAAVEGVILLIDATQGVQAQTIANLYLAMEQDLVIIPVINKIDMANAAIEDVEKEIADLLGGNEDIIKISAKTGKNVSKVLEKIIREVPAPQGNEKKPTRALIFDSYFDSYKGVIAEVRVIDGEIKSGDKIYFMKAEYLSEILEVGIMKPHFERRRFLSTGDIGYVVTSLKDVEKCKVGDTIARAESLYAAREEKNSSCMGRIYSVKPLPGYKEVKPVIFASVYPIDGDDHLKLKDALEKLKLNDDSLFFEAENSVLGQGFRCGFLGMLHLEIISERLNREYDVNVIITTPSVSYRVVKRDGNTLDIFSPVDMPDPPSIEQIQEPFAKLEIVLPQKKIGSVMKLAKNARAVYKSVNYLSKSRVILLYEAPLANIIVDFYDSLKGVSSGFASMNYEFIGFRKEDMIRLDISVNGERIDALSRIVPRSVSYREGKRIVTKLKELIPRQNFSVPIQAATSGKIIARETIKPYKKDVTAKLYGGDVTRKRKLLEKQKRGKKRMKSFGKIKIPQEVFLSVLKKE